MTLGSDMKLIEKAALRGAKITSMHALDGHYEGIQTLTCYFTVDRGFTFTLPWPGEPWHQVEVPEEARTLTEVYMGQRPSLISRTRIKLGIWGDKIKPIEIVSLVMKRSLKGIFICDQGSDLDCYGPENVFLLFEDGARLGCLSAAPEGIAPGLAYSHEKDHDECERIVDFFDLPMHNESE